MSKKLNYYKELYAVCLEMIQNSEKYKDYDLYEIIQESVALKGKNGLGDYMILSESERAMNLHNRLKNSYEFIDGVGKLPVKKHSPKGYDIMPQIDTSALTNEQIIEMLNTFYKLSIVKDGNEIGSDRKWKKLKENLYYVDIEKSKQCLNYLIELVNGGKIKDFDYRDENGNLVKADELNGDENEQLVKTDELNKDENEQLVKVAKSNRESYFILDQIYNLFRLTLIFNGPTNAISIDISDITEKYHKSIKYYKDNLCKGEKDHSLRIMEQKYSQFGKLEKYYYAWLYMDLCCHSILQYVISVIKCSSICTDKCEIIDQINSILLKCIEEEDVLAVKPAETISETMFRLYSYYYIRDKFLEDTQKIKYIMVEGGKRDMPRLEYSIMNYNLTDKSMKSMQKIFCEGKDVNERTFKKHIKNCDEGRIKINQKYGRYISDNLYSLKAMYREIYVDKTKYNRRTSQSIFNQFLESDEIRVDDYYFLNEKINLGLFREHGWINEYYRKNALQENLYALVSLILARLNPDDIVNSFDKVLDEISEVIALIEDENDLFNLLEE